MSFNDAAKQKFQLDRMNKNSTSATSSNSTKSTDPIIQVTELLQNLQKNCSVVKDKITETKRKSNITAVDKSDLDKRLKELRDLDTQIKNQLESQHRALESLAKTETSQKRLTIGKLQKDNERLRNLIQSLISEASSIKPTESKKSSSSAFIEENKTGIANEGSEYGDLKIQSQLIKVQEVDIDSLIIEERERDIKKINQDILLVNEMFKDMAQIVEKQNDMVEEIHQHTEESNIKAQEGLANVKQAAKHQGACIIS